MKFLTATSLIFLASSAAVFANPETGPSSTSLMGATSPGSATAAMPVDLSSSSSKSASSDVKPKDTSTSGSTLLSDKGDKPSVTGAESKKLAGGAKGEKLGSGKKGKKLAAGNGKKAIVRQLRNKAKKAKDPKKKTQFKQCASMVENLHLKAGAMGKVRSAKGGKSGAAGKGLGAAAAAAGKDAAPKADDAVAAKGGKTDGRADGVAAGDKVKTTA